MNGVVKRIGYFLRELVKGSTGDQKSFYVIRYFLIDNQHGIHYTENYAQLVHLLKSSKTLREAFERADRELKKIKVSEIKVSEVKKYTQPEILSFLNKTYIDVTVAMSSDLADNSTLTGAKGEEAKKFMFFSFKDHHLPIMQRFLASYDKTVTSPQCQQEEVEALEWDQPNLKDTSKQQQMEKALQDKLSSLAEQLSHVKEIEDAIVQLESKKSAAALEKVSSETEGVSQPKDVPVDDSTATPQQSTDETPQTNDSLTLADSAEKVNTEHNSVSSPIVSNYSGPTVEGKPEGKGKEHINDEISYVGDYKAGKRHGIGYFVLANQGMCYVESINGKISGI